MKTTKCVICGKSFSYDNYKRKCCSDNCLSEYKSQLTSKQRGLNYDKVIGTIEKYVVYNYKEYGIIKTLKECLKETHIFAEST